MQKTIYKKSDWIDNSKVTFKVTQTKEKTETSQGKYKAEVIYESVLKEDCQNLLFKLQNRII